MTGFNKATAAPALPEILPGAMAAPVTEEAGLQAKVAERP